MQAMRVVLAAPGLHQRCRLPPLPSLPPGEVKSRRKSKRAASQKLVMTHRKSTNVTAESDNPPARSPAALSHVPSSSVSASDKEPYPVPTSSAVQFSA